MGKKSGGSSAPTTQSVTQKVEIPSFLRPLAESQGRVGGAAVDELSGLLAGGDILVQPVDPLQTRAEDMALGIAEGDDPVMSSLRDQLLSTARGDFLFGGDQFQAAVDAAVRAAQPSILSTFGAAGRGRGGLAQAAIGRQATDAFARMFGQERQRQLGAIAALPQFDAASLDARLAPSEVLARIGAQRSGRAFNRQIAPVSAQEALLQASGGGVPLGSLLGSSSSSTSTQPIFRNRAAGLLGGAGAAAGLGSALGFSNPFTLGAFALGGGLLGGAG